MTVVDEIRRLHVIQGEYKVSSDPHVVISTLLGSCVSACIFDSVARVGGMNHFLLPGDLDRRSDRERERFGAHLMELLINALMKAGARRERLQAKLFGGARVVQGLSDIGSKNADFAERYLVYEGIVVAARDLGGERGRRVHFTPTTGRAQVSYVAADVAAREDAPRRQPASIAGEIELFKPRAT